MKLLEVFEHLAGVELSQLSYSEAGTIQEQHYPTIIRNINLGLTALYKRFLLKEGRLQLELVPERVQYPLNSRFAVASRKSREPVRFIRDSTAAPFRDDVHKVERVYTDAGVELRLNDLEDVYSLHTPSLQVLEIPSVLLNPGPSDPTWLRTTGLRVIYRANHAKIDPEAEPEITDIELPESHLEPLLYFVASRFSNPTGQAEFNAGNTYFMKYEAACQQLENQGMRIQQEMDVDRLRQQGFV